MLYPVAEIEMLAAGQLDHAEGVAVGRDGTIYAGGEAGQVYRIRPDGGKVEEFANTRGFCLGLALDPEENLFICDLKRRAVVRVSQAGKSEVFADAAGERKFVLPNFPVFDRSGRLYVSDSGGFKQRNGVIYRIDRAGRAEIFSPGPFHFTNGLALDAEEKYLYVVESNLDRVVKIEIRPDGTPGAISVAADGMHSVPDGLAFDAAGNLYVTCYASDCLYRVAPDGRSELLAQDIESLALNQPTNCAFGGPGFDRLYVANLGGRHLAMLDLRAKGQPLWAHQGLAWSAGAAPTAGGNSPR